MKLISMREFVLEIEKTPIDETDWVKFNKKNLDKIFSYAEFLSQPITLGMFVPCDLDGNILEEPYYSPDFQYKFDEKVKEYQQAKEHVLFEGFEWKEAEFCDEPMLELFLEGTQVVFIYDCEDKTFEIEEDVSANKLECIIKYDLALTQQAIKQITP